MAKKFFGNNTLSSFIDNLLGICPSKELSEEDTQSLWGEINKPVEPEPEPITEVAWIWGVATDNFSNSSAIFNNANKNVSIKDITTNTIIYSGTTNSMSQFGTDSNINLHISIEHDYLLTVGTTSYNFNMRNITTDWLDDSNGVHIYYVDRKFKLNDGTFVDMNM